MKPRGIVQELPHGTYAIAQEFGGLGGRVGVLGVPHGVIITLDNANGSSFSLAGLMGLPGQFGAGYGDLLDAMVLA